ncbi:MAG TPA: hypothetical protein VMU32_11880 [Solirubrobacteraceae bacterium]|nr:hypothetical protein [Solirubrobacteraceae bacterium]
MSKATIAASLAASALLLASAAAPPGAAASEDANWGTGVELSPPANAAEDPSVYLRKLSCPSVGNCTAVGSYEMPSEHEEEPPREQGMLQSETGGSWGRGVEVAMPAGAATDPKVEFGALSCPSVGNCTAVGDYRENAEHEPERGFLLDESAGAWEPALEVSLPAGVSSDQVVFDDLSCPSAGNCVAAGKYVNASDEWQGFLVSETAGSWHAALEPPLPANAASNRQEDVTGVSCASAGDCTAVGSYQESAGHGEGVLWTETGGTWAPGTESALPANAGSSSELRAISCPSAEDCTAVGEYTAASGHSEGFMLGESAGTWGAAVEASLPANASSAPGADVHIVRCASAGNCTAVGIYVATSPEESDEAMFLTETAGVWGAAVERPLPADAGPQLVIEGSLSCPAAGDCGYVGNYKVGEFISRALLETENDGAWGPGIAGQLPANATGDPGAFLSSVSCTSPGDCTAVGSYNSYTGGNFVERQGMVFTAAPTTASLSVSGPLGGAFAGSPIAAAQISATLAGGSAPSGPITFTVFGPQATPPSSCAAGGTVLGSASAYGDGSYQPSAGFTPPSPGRYWWYASYGGDAGDEPSTATCGSGMPETTVLAKATPTLVASGPLGGAAGSPISAASISATLAEGSSPTGTIAFTVFGPQSSPPSSCASGGTTVGSASVNGDGVYQPSAGFTPPAPGEYWWYAGYGGSAGDEPAASACGALMAQTLVVAAPVGESGSESKPGSGGGSGGGTGTGAKAPAPALSGVKLASRRLAASDVEKGVALRLAVSQAATIEVRVARDVKAHVAGGACRLTARVGKSCTATVEKRTMTFSGSTGSNVFKLRLAGLRRGSYAVTITAENANGRSSPVRLAFTITDN